MSDDTSGGMDDLLGSLESSFRVSKTTETSGTHPRFTQYKKTKDPKENQEKRRKDLLQKQRESRIDYFNLTRRLAEGDFSVELGVVSDEEEPIETDTSLSDVSLNKTTLDQAASGDAKPKNVKTKKQPRRRVESSGDEAMDTTGYRKAYRRKHHRHQLMHSEWLVDVPSDLASNWLLVLCPAGKRCLVLTFRGQTKVYSKTGQIITTFSSLLPGGNNQLARGSQPAGHSFTVLDCILCETKKMLYVLDVMCWNGHAVYDSETSFRFFWLISKFQETPELSQHSFINKYRFVPLANYACDPVTLQRVFDLDTPLPFEQGSPKHLDGLLFYHKETHYTPGSTPLVGWLKAYMVPEILGVPIGDHLKKQQPNNYSGLNSHQGWSYAKQKSDFQKSSDSFHGYGDVANKILRPGRVFTRSKQTKKVTTTNENAGDVGTEEKNEGTANGRKVEIMETVSCDTATVVGETAAERNIESMETCVEVEGAGDVGEEELQVQFHESIAADLDNLVK